jgi:hypothetical protein
MDGFRDKRIELTRKARIKYDLNTENINEKSMKKFILGE